MARPIPDMDQMTAAEVATDDSIIIDDTSAGETKRIPVGDLLGLPKMGWVAAGQVWTFSSFNSSTRIGVATVPSNATTKYSVGMRIQFTQSTGGTKYGFVVAVTSTTISIFFGLSVTFNNEAISTPYYSTEYMPFGYTGPMLTREMFRAQTTNTERWVYSISGWGSMAGISGSLATEVRTYGMTFASAPIVQISFAGHSATASSYPPTAPSGYTDNMMANAAGITTTDFFASLARNGATFNAAHTLFYGYQVKGAVA